MVSARHLLCSTTRVPHQFQPIAELQETQHPGNAGFNLAFSKYSACLRLRGHSGLDPPNDRPKEGRPIVPNTYALRPYFLSRVRRIDGKGSGIWERTCSGSFVGPQAEFIGASHWHHDRRWGLIKTGQHCTLGASGVGGQSAASWRISQWDIGAIVSFGIMTRHSSWQRG